MSDHTESTLACQVLTRIDYIIIALLGILAYHSLNYLANHEPGTDASIFTSVSYHMLHGRALYSEVWDHKPPGIYFINALALSVAGYDYDSIHILSRVFSVAGIALLYVFLRHLIISPSIAAVFSLFFLFHFYHPMIFEEGGNLTEEYAGILLLAGIMATLCAATSSGVRSAILALVSGVMLTSSALTKEPFLLSAAPWVLYLFLAKPHNFPRWMLRTSFFLFGLVFPLLMFLFYLMIHDSIWDWIDVLSYNIEYSSKLGISGSIFYRYLQSAYQGLLLIGRQSTFTLVFAVIGIVFSLAPNFNRIYRFLPITLTATLLLSIFGAALSGRGWGHYYLQLVPAYIALSAFGFVVFVREFLLAWRKGGIALIVFSVALLLNNVSNYYIFTKRFAAYPLMPVQLDPISNYISRNKATGDTLWAGSGINAKYYLSTRLLAPTKYLYVFDHIFIDTSSITAKMRYDGLLSDLLVNKPRFIILSDSARAMISNVLSSDIGKFVDENYSAVANGANHRGVLYERRDSSNHSNL